MDINRQQQQKKPAEYSKPCLQYIGNLGDLTSGDSGRKRETGKNTTNKKRQRTRSAGGEDAQWGTLN